MLQAEINSFVKLCLHYLLNTDEAVHAVTVTVHILSFLRNIQLLADQAYTKKSLFPVASPRKFDSVGRIIFFYFGLFFYSSQPLIQMNTQDMHALKHAAHNKITDWALL